MALAAVLHADACEIYTDVDGVYTTDPRVLPEARRVQRISYDEMLELASLGAGVMHNRSIEFAKKFGVPIHVRSSFSDAPGSMIVAEPESADAPVCGAALMKDEARVSVLGVPDVPGTSLEILLADRGPEHLRRHDRAERGRGRQGRLSFTVPRNELRATLEAVEEAAEALGAEEVNSDETRRQGLRRRAGHGPPVRRRPPHVPRLGRRRRQHPDDHDQRDQDLGARRTRRGPSGAAGGPRDVRAAGGTGRSARAVRRADVGRQAPMPRPSSSRLQGVDMEELTIDDIALDTSQARITMRGVPDTPGVAAAVFEEVAAADVFVDMIVQSDNGREGQASLSLHRAARPARQSAGRGQAAGRAVPVPGRSPAAPRSPSSRSPASACAATPASPSACSAPWPTRASTSR